MDPYRPNSCAIHRFFTFHMFVDELCLQLIYDYRTAVYRPKAQAQQSDFLCMQGVRHDRQQPLRSLLWNVQQVSEETAIHGVQKHAPQQMKTMFWCATCPSTSASVLAAHAGVIITLQFSFGVELTQE